MRGARGRVVRGARARAERWWRAERSVVWRPRCGGCFWEVGGFIEGEGRCEGCIKKFVYIEKFVCEFSQLFSFYYLVKTLNHVVKWIFD